MQHSVLNTSAHKTQTFCTAALYLAIAAYPVHAAEPEQIPMRADRWTTVLGNVNFVEHMGKPSIELLGGDYMNSRWRSRITSTAGASKCVSTI